MAINIDAAMEQIAKKKKSTTEKSGINIDAAMQQIAEKKGTAYSPTPSSVDNAIPATNRPATTTAGRVSTPTPTRTFTPFGQASRLGVEPTKLPENYMTSQNREYSTSLDRMNRYGGGNFAGQQARIGATLQDEEVYNRALDELMQKEMAKYSEKWGDRTVNRTTIPEGQLNRLGVEQTTPKTVSRNKQYDDDFLGQAQANYYRGRLSQDENAAFSRYVNDPTEANKAYAENIKALNQAFTEKNANLFDAVGPDGKPLGKVNQLFSQTGAGYLPQFFDQMKAGIGGAIAGGAAGSVVPVLGTAAGAKAGYVAGTGVYSYNLIQGAAYSSLIDAGIDEQTAMRAASDEALVSSMIEMVDAGVDLLTLGGGAIINSIAGQGIKQTAKALAKEGAYDVAESALKKYAKALAAYGINILGEGAEEFTQEYVSMANIDRMKSGDQGGGALGLAGDAVSKLLELNPAELKQAGTAGIEGMKIAALMGGASAAVNYSVANGIDTSRAKSYGKMMKETGNVDDIVSEGLASPNDSVSFDLASKLSEKIKRGETPSDADVGKLYIANVKIVATEKVEAEPVSPEPETLNIPSKWKNRVLTTPTAEQAGGISVNEAINRTTQEEPFTDNTGAFGKSGVHILNQAYDPTVDRATYYSDFARVYTAAKNGQDISTVDLGVIDENTAKAIYVAQEADAASSTQQKYFGKDSGLVRNQTLANARIPSSAKRTLDTLAKTIGVKIELVDSITDADGHEANASISGGVIRVAMNSDQPLFTATVHEAVHRIKSADADSYNQLRALVYKALQDDNNEQLIKSLKARSSLYGTLNQETISEELVADAIGYALGDEKTLRQVLGDNRTLIQKVYDVIADMITAVRRALDNKSLKLSKEQRVEFKALEKNLSELQRTVKTALANVKEVAETKNTTKPTETKYSLKDSDGRQLTEAQAEFFKDSKVRDMDGNLLRMYHGTSSDFTVFDKNKIGSTGAFEGTGFNFTPSSSRATSYAGTKNGKKNVLDGYVNVTNPLSNDKITFKTRELANLIAEIDPTGDNLISNYAKNTRDYGTETFVKREALVTARAMAQYYDNDVDIYSELSAGAGGYVGLMDAFKAMGYDGLIHYNQDGKIQTVVTFDSSQFKNFDNANPTENPDIRYSLKQMDKAYLAAAEAGDTETAQRMVDEAAKKAGYTIKAYHGTPKGKFNVFSKDLIGSTTDYGWFGKGFYFTTKKDVAEVYADSLKESAVISAYLRVNNVFDFGERDGSAGEIISQVLGKEYGDWSGVSEEQKAKRSSDFTDWLRDNGYDGAKVWSQYLILDANQAKSTDPITRDDDGNIIPLSERFNPDNEDIRFSRKGLSEAEKLVEKYGAIKRGENPVRNVKVPKQTTPTDRVRQFARTAIEAGATTDELAKILEQEVADGTFSYDPIPDKSAQAYADDVVTNLGIDKGMAIWEGVVTGSSLATKEQIALAERLYVEAAQAGDYDTAVKLAAEIAAEGTRAGQAVQAMRLLKKMSGTGQMYYVDRVVANLQKDLNKRFKKDTVKIAQIKLEIKSLEEQAVTAEQTAEVAAQKVEALKELKEAVEQFEAAEAELAAQQKAVEDTKNQIAKYRSGKTAATKQTAEIAKKVAALETKLSEAEEALAASRKRRDDMAAQKSELMERLKSTLGEIDKANRREYSDWWNAQLLVKEIGKAQDELKAAEAKADKAKSLKQQIAALKQQLKDFEQIEIPDELRNALVGATSQEEIDAAVDAILDNVASQVPSTWFDKWNAWRYLAMLGNPRTHIRNIFGNAIFIPMVTMKNIIAAGIEAVWQPEVRTKSLVGSLPGTGGKYRDFAITDYAEVEEFLHMGGKMNPSDIIRDRQRMFSWSTLEWLRKQNFKLLEKEDNFFLKFHYTRAMTQYLSANNINLETMDGKTLIAARDYAIKEAQKATYRDASAFANTLNKMSRQNSPLGIIIEGIMPFKKTTVNILKRGMEYSPLGVLETVTRQAKKLKSGDINANDFIDRLASGLTGTGIMALGLYLASQGLLTASKGDDKEDEYEELLGEQEYSIVLGDTRYSIDWMMPFALPLFLGAEIHNANQEEYTAAKVLDAATLVTEPMFNLSMLNGLNNTIKAAKDAKNPLFGIGREVLLSYFGQAIPTLSGQIARTIDDTRRTTYTDKNSPIPTALQYPLQKNLNKIPFVSEKQLPYIDAWGRTEKTGKNMASRAAQNMLSPGYVSTYGATKMEKELKRLAKAADDTGVLPSRASNSFSLKGNDYYLTAEQYEKYATKRGQTAYTMLTNLIDKPTIYGYSKLSDTDKAAYVKRVYDYANAVAKMQVSNYEPDGWIKQAIEGEKLGIKPLTVIQFYSTSDTDGNSYRSKDEKEQAVNAIKNLTQKQKDFLLGK